MELHTPETEALGDDKNKRKTHRHLCLLVGFTEKRS